MKGGSTVLEKSREQRSGTFTPNKRDPSEFITAPNAGATRLHMKPQNPPTSNAAGFTKNPAVFCPQCVQHRPRVAQPSTKHSEEQGDKLCTRASLITRS